ncbi:activating transcription factor 7-interacting protein 1-like isoform X2 [Sipha flava]|uniref:Activating transcription factor 7-interacting protein 1-like isoform X2 n=1 Tax=Sipha flava TaxID=143950 RepID=A0A8B8G095_9HEMI|nr:activating transcription factor 7-interacting protein 1-like isoform X2 [Sipha flava]
MADKDFPDLLKCFKEKDMNLVKFDSICNEKMLEVMSEKLGGGRRSKEIQKVLEIEKAWRSKYTLLHKECEELINIFNMNKENSHINPNARRHIVTRNVGLQAELIPEKDSSVQSLKENIATTSVQQHEQPSEAMNITSDDENNVIAVLDDMINPKPSCSKNVECATNTTPIKQKPSITNKLPIDVSIKSVLPAVSINEDNTCTVDLTDNDNIKVSNEVSLDKTPTKIVQQATLNARESPGILSAQLTTKPHILPKNITYLEIPNLSNCNSGYIERASSPIQQPVSVGQTLKPVQVKSTLKSVQVQHHSKSNVPLQPVPSAIPILKHPAPLPAPPLQINVSTSKKIPPAPIMTLAKSGDKKALVLSWNMNLDYTHAEISGYQIFGYIESPTDIPRSDLWKEIGNVNALPLPMACSLSKFVAGEKYHFAVRAKDIYCRVGPFSLPNSIDSTF